ncbi:MAG: hypothetical protein IT569_10135 [Leptospiraceae bacterium]|nr:hypothetical protein [Leptospiraceae bacterium]
MGRCIKAKLCRISNLSVFAQRGTNVGSDLKGESCSHSVLWLVSWGDSSIESAKKAGKISSVSSVEYQQLGVLAGGLYLRFCTIVLGSAQVAAKAQTQLPQEATQKKPGRQ